MSSSTRTLPGLADPPEVVALEVDEHDVLGALLGMRGELGHLARVVRRAGGCAGACRRWAACRRAVRSTRTSRSGEELSDCHVRATARAPRTGAGLAAHSRS